MHSISGSDFPLDAAHYHHLCGGKGKKLLRNYLADRCNPCLLAIARIALADISSVHVLGVRWTSLKLCHVSFSAVVCSPVLILIVCALFTANLRWRQEIVSSVDSPLKTHSKNMTKESTSTDFNQAQRTNPKLKMCFDPVSLQL